MGGLTQIKGTIYVLDPIKESPLSSVSVYSTLSDELISLI